MRSLFDPGLQPERTELAWRRTCLALGVGSLVAMRILPQAFGSGWWVLGGVAGILASAGLWLAARRRYRQGTRALERHGDRALMPESRLTFALAAFTVVIGVVSACLILAVR
jgi:uncharacterized membrane protein YidH (DUF202 family)